MGNLQSADNCEYCEPPAIFWSFELRAEQNARAVIITRLKSIAYNLHADLATAKINIKSLSAILSVFPHQSQGRRLSVVMLRPRRENGKMLFVLLCVFFWLYFSLVTISTSGLQLSASLN